MARARRICRAAPLTPSLNLNAAIVRTTIQGLAARRRCGSEPTSQVTGSSRGAARQAEMAQVFQRFEGEANVRYLTIIGHSRVGSRLRPTPRCARAGGTSNRRGSQHHERKENGLWLTLISARGP